MSWEQLRAIYRADAAERQARAAMPPPSCPNDGTPYQTGPDGDLRCPFDGHVPGPFEGR